MYITISFQKTMPSFIEDNFHMPVMLLDYEILRLHTSK